jgi:hypothetical protein
MALNPDRIDAAFYDELRRHYSEEEIVELGTFIGFNIGYTEAQIMELGAFIAFHYGMQAFTRTLRLRE